MYALYIVLFALKYWCEIFYTPEFASCPCLQSNQYALTERSQSRPPNYLLNWQTRELRSQHEG
jgi:hypothetical protein